MKMFLWIILCFFCITSCNYSKYSIDNTPTLKIQSELVGIWKAVEDTDKANFILVQADEDVHAYSYQLESNHALLSDYFDTVRKQFGDRMNVDTEEIIKNIKATNAESRRTAGFSYFFTYFNRHGKNPYLQQFNASISEIKGAHFFNITYWHQPEGKLTRENGYLLLKVLRTSPNQDTVTTALVSDATLKTTKSSAEVRSRITKNLNNKKYYSDTVHFYKVKGGHFGLNEAVKLANK